MCAFTQFLLYEHSLRIPLVVHGPGVPAAERELVFERFRRGARERDGSTPGVGLGLYLARELLRRGGGDRLLRRLRQEEGDREPGLHRRASDAHRLRVELR